MASQSAVQRLDVVAGTFEKFDMSKVYRVGLGDASLKQAKEFTDDLARKIALAYSVKDVVADQSLAQFTDNVQAFVQAAQSISSVSDASFVDQKMQLLEQLRAPMNTIAAMIWPTFIAAAVEKSGILSSSALQIEQIHNAATAALEEFKKETEQLVTVQKRQIEELTSRVRKTAENISVAQAQSQFESASHTLWNKAKAWGAGSVISFVGFVVFALYLMHHPPASLLGTQLQQTAKAVKETSGSETQIPISLVVAQTAYLTAIRITLLTALGALTTFCLRMMRSAIHMAEYNDHRRRIANSISSFVEAAGTPEQRDAILLRLVDSVVQFGESGLLENEKDSVSAPTIAFEAITKNLTQAK